LSVVDSSANNLSSNTVPKDLSVVDSSANNLSSNTVHQDQMLSKIWKLEYELEQERKNN